MPIYEYQCQACEHEFEALQKMSEDALVDCPQCHQAELKKLISAAAFHLKGSGWYQSDFKNSSASKESKKAAATSSTPASATPAKTSCCSSSACGCS